MAPHAVLAPDRPDGAVSCAAPGLFSRGRLADGRRVLVRARTSTASPTSNKEIYDMYDMTAAHRTLPFGTHVMVTNLENDRSAIVRDQRPGAVRRRPDHRPVLCRGPGPRDGRPGHGPGPSGDPAGRSRPRRTRAGRPSGSRSAPSPSQENAYAIKRRLDRTFRGVVVSRLKTDRGTYFRVRVRSRTRASPGALAERLAGEGYPVIIVRE